MAGTPKRDTSSPPSSRSGFLEVCSHYMAHIIILLVGTMGTLTYKFLTGKQSAPPPAPIVLHSSDGKPAVGVEASDLTGHPMLRTDRSGIFCDEAGTPSAPAAWGRAGTVLRVYFKGRVEEVEVTTDERGNPEPIHLDTLFRKSNGATVGSGDVAPTVPLAQPDRNAGGSSTATGSGH